MIRALGIGMAGLMALGLSTGTGAAHPHVFADTTIGFERNAEGDVTALTVRWHYDAFTSLTLWEILDLDPDRDGVLDAVDFAMIAAGETDWPPGYTGDLHIGEGPGFAAPRHASAGEEDQRIWVAFTLPFEAPRPADGLRVEIYDPGYYYAYTTEAVAPEGCAVDVIQPDLDDGAMDLRAQLAALSQEEMPEDPNVGEAFAETVLLTCN
ncbi:DUF1007 family protein [Jannaschia seohaensis]|uniref:ABC-type uncharacterized transport system substrate-binding protein n=1 Tax=Jannaschia seohaensis TaxID=475081 RepID=A0A2Y9A2D0_9RHOB|nr:DUF1007 family protein [Jannaschia seohaensis]PWJ21738.1 ABC-type uncharacterized transport system substrate-binding protein [Jannaschia seohaensis]SSA38016.1 ABC-type uncharacterized transport system, substrate-binding protein [Jannaschia seohaensis]